MHHHRLLRVLLVALAAVFATAGHAAAAVSSTAANQRALKALGVKQGKAPVVVFRASSPLGAGSVLSQAGEAAPPTPSGKLGTAAAKAPALLSVGARHRAWAFYADWAPYQAYAHRGQLALVDVRTGAVRLSGFLTSPPVINGRLPEFMRSSRAYRAASSRIFERGYEVGDAAAFQAAARDAFGYKLDRAPLSDIPLARAAADQLAADHACVLRVSDTFGEFYDFTGADNTRARLGDLLYVLRQLNPAIVDERYSRGAGSSPIARLATLIETKGCKDVFLYVAGRGFSKGGGTTISVGTRVRGPRVTQQLVRAGDLLTLIRSKTDVKFNVEIDAPHSKPFVQAIAGEPNVLVAGSAAGDDGVSFGYLPAVQKNGKTIADTGNPDAILSLTNRTVSGIQRFLTTASEVNGAIDARKAGTAPSFLAIMLGRAFKLGLADDLPSLVGLQQPFISGSGANPQAPQSAGGSNPNKPNPSATPAPNGAPLVTPSTVTTPEDTPVSLGVGAADPDGDGLALTITTPPAHGTAVVTGGLQVTYTPNADYAGPDSFEWKVNDGNGHNPGHTVSIVVTGVNDKPRTTTSAGNATFTEPTPPVVIDGALQLVDVDDTTLTGATVAITAGGSPDDELLFTNQAGITGSFSAASGLLTLSGSATVAAYQTALRSVTFRINSPNPAAGTRTVAFRAADAEGLGAAATRNVAVVTVNDPPVLGNTPGTTAYTENDAPAAIDSTFAISDPDSVTMAGATVSITVGFASAEDRLRFTTQNGITGSYNAATGLLTLSGSASRADYETALKSVAYENLSDAPSTATRTISTKVNDGAADSNTVTSSISVAAVNDKPTVTTTAGTATYAEDGAAVVVDPTVTLADVDSANLSGATVTIGANADPADVLGFTNQNGITGSFNAGTGALTLTGSATKADYQTALRSVTFLTPGDNPSTLTRSIGFKATDSAAADSTVALRGVAVTAANDAPVLAGAGGTTNYTEDDAAAPIAPALTVADPDDANIASATVTLGSGQAGDVLGFTDQNGITGSFNAGTGVLSLTGSATKANYQVALRSVTFSTPSQNPSTANRTAAFVVNDGALASNTTTQTISVTAANDAPTVTTTSGTVNYTEDAAATTIDSAITVTDPDNGLANGASVSIGTGFSSGDVLGFVNQSGITGSYSGGSGVLTLTGSATIPAYQAALRSVTFSTPSQNPSTATRTIGFKVTDSSAATSTTATRGVTVTALNDAPTLAGGGTSATFTEDGAAALAGASITVADPDSANLASATVAITGGFASGDTLAFTNQNGISGSYNSGTGALTLTGSATLSQYQTALRSITFSTPSQNPSTADRAISFTGNDGVTDGNTVTTTVQVAGANDAPIVTTSAGSNTFTEGGSAVVIDGALTVSDVDNANLVSATVSVSPFPQTGDTLSFTNQSGIIGSYTPGTGVLALVGSATVAQYQAALRSITYSSSATSLPSGTRQFFFTVNDGTAAATGSTKTLTYTAINSAPVVTASAGSTAVTEGASGAVIDAAVTVTDADDATIASAKVAVTAGFIAGDTLSFTDQNGITGSYDSGTGVLSLSGSTTKANYQAALQTVKFSNAGPAAPTGSRTITFSATDSSADSGSDTKAITFTAADDAPTVATSAGSTAYTENDAPTTVDAALILSDVDSASLASAQVSLTDAVAGDRLAVPGAYPVPGTLTVTGSGTTTIDISGSASPAAYRDLLRAITFENTTDSPTGATRHVRFRASDATTTTTAPTDKAIAVTAVNDSPVGVTETITTDEDTLKTADVRSNDVDADDLTSTLVVDQVNGAGGNVGTQLTTAKGAKVTIDAAGNLSYDPSGAFDSLQVGDPNGTDSVTYRLKDPGNATSNTVTVNFVVTALNDAPKAVARTYNAVANAALELEPAVNSGITAPKVRIDGDLTQGATDADDPIGGTPITNNDALATTGGGTVDVDPDGSFVYTSEPGETATSDSFTFQINDSHGASSTQTVTLALKARVFFVDADNAGAQTGTSTKPFADVTAAGTAATAAADVIYVGASALATASAATLDNGQTVIGAGKALTANLGATGTPSGTVTLQAAGTRPVLTASSGSTLTLGSGNTLTGFDIDNTGSAKGISAASAGAVSISDVAVNDTGTATTGTAVDLTGASGTISNLDITTKSATGLKLAGSSVDVGSGSSVDATGGVAVDSSGSTGGSLSFGNVSSTNSPTAGLDLAGAAAFSATSGAIADNGGTGILVTGGAAAISYPGNVTPDAGISAAAIASRTGGTVTLSGALSGGGASAGFRASGNSGGTIALSGSTKSFTTTSGNAVDLSSNTGATVNITGGGLTASSTSGSALQATGGGTLQVAGANNTLSAGIGGSALHVGNVNTNGLTFKSITDTGGPEGVYLDATGTGASLTVTGDATTTRNTSGGTVSGQTGGDGSSSGNGVYLNDTDGVSLEQMQISGVQNNGISASNVNGLSFQHGTITNNGNNEAAPFSESNVRLTTATGTLAFDDNAISTPQANNVYLTHDAGTASISVTGSTLTMDPNRTGIQNDSVLVDGGNTGNVTATITGNTFTGAAGDHIQIAPGGGATANAAWTATISNNTLASSLGSSGPDDLGGGITLSPAAFNGSLTYDLTSNTATGTNQGAAIAVAQGTGSSSVSGKLVNNTVGTVGTQGSGSFQSSGIAVNGGGTGTNTVLVSGNHVSGVGTGAAVGILIQGNQGATTGVIRATATNNTVDTPNAGGTFAGLYANLGVTTGQTGTSCVDIQNTTVSGTYTGAQLAMRRRRDIIVQLPGYTGALGDTAAVTTYLAGRNSVPGANMLITDAAGTLGGFTNTSPAGAACPQPA